MPEPMFLSIDEVVELTGKRRHSLQAEILRTMGIEHKVRADGRVLVLRKYLEQEFGVKSSKKKEPVFEPNWEAAK